MSMEALPGVLGNRGTRAFFSGEQRPKKMGNRGTQAILGNIENQDFIFGGQGNNAIFFEAKKRKQVPPPPPGGPQYGFESLETLQSG